MTIYDSYLTYYETFTVLAEIFKADLIACLSYMILFINKITSKCLLAGLEFRGLWFWSFRVIN